MNNNLVYFENGLIGLNDFVPCHPKLGVTFALSAAPIAKAEFFIFARKKPGTTTPFSFSLNGTEYSAPASPSHFDGGGWLRCTIDATAFKAGNNFFACPQNDGWKIAVESRSGALVVRLRMDNAVADWRQETEPVFPIYGDSRIENDRTHWLSLLPEPLRAPPSKSSRWQWCWELAGFLSAAWEYSNLFDGEVYAPWDARKILQWGGDQRDDEGRKPIAMCVHYAVALVQFCIAAGVPTRAIVLTPGMHSLDGHFVAEVWLEEYSAWAMLDVNMHLCYRETAPKRPLAVAELYQQGEALREMAEFGESWTTQRKRFANTVGRDYLTAKVYRYWGVWARHDWIENPEFSPPAHGSFAYCETDIIWCAENETTKDELAMFPHFLSAHDLSISPKIPSS